jgi:sarcosine oxidase gamma subunit
VVEVLERTVVVACADVGAALVTVLDAAPGGVVGEGVCRAGWLVPDEHDVAATASARTASRGRLNDEVASQDAGQ